MYRIRKEFHFSAAHHLVGLPSDHPCSRVHGHNYVVVLELAALDLDGAGFVLDYSELRTFARFIDSLDHQDLNEAIDKNPTAENLAKVFFDFASGVWPQTAAVMVAETPKTWAEYRPGAR